MRGQRLRCERQTKKGEIVNQREEAPTFAVLDYTDALANIFREDRVDWLVRRETKIMSKQLHICLC